MVFWCIFFLEKKQCEVSDVLVLNKNGEISCYYVDENYPQYLAGFIRINTSGALITMETIHSSWIRKWKESGDRIEYAKVKV